MSGCAHHIDAQVIDVYRLVRERLHRVGVERDPVCMRAHCEFADWLDGAYLVVCKYDGCEDGVGPDRSLEIVNRYQSFPIYGKVGDLEAFFLECLATVQDCMMLDSARDDVFTLRRVRTHEPFDGPVVRLGAARGEVDLLALRADRLRDGFPRPRDRIGSLLAQVVDGGGVAIFLAEVREHRL